MKCAIIGGTGIDQSFPIQTTALLVDTPYGQTQVFTCEKDLVFLPRHGLAHGTPPHMINYRANIWALKELGVQYATAIYAVGSITDILPPGTWGVANDFIDVTGGGRLSTFHDGIANGVRHVAMDEPFSARVSAEIVAHAPHPIAVGGVYACTNGPRLETPAEIRKLARDGADYVGMTAATEASLAMEAGIALAGVVFSINWAAGIDTGGVSFIGDDAIAGLTVEIVDTCVHALGACAREE